MNEASRWNPAWQLPMLKGSPTVPIVYSKGKAPTNTPEQQSDRHCQSSITGKLA
ncbi:hypothetical protein [Aeromonas sp. 97A]|uniref:hypothetical protein n=1 Tax=Aeromonas sp. 97A TaxID=3452731 RepID=UPI003F794B35